MGNTSSMSAENNINKKNMEFRIIQDYKELFYKSITKDDITSCIHYYEIFTQEYPDVLKDINFVTWILSNIIQKKAMRILHIIPDKMKSLLNQESLNEVLFEVISESSYPSKQIIDWLLKNDAKLEQYVVDDLNNILDDDIVEQNYKKYLLKVLGYITKEASLSSLESIPEVIEPEFLFENKEY